MGIYEIYGISTLIVKICLQARDFCKSGNGSLAGRGLFPRRVSKFYCNILKVVSQLYFIRKPTHILSCYMEVCN